MAAEKETPVSESEEEFIDLEDRKIGRSHLEKHRELVESAAKKFVSKASWLRVKDGFRREK